jgi:hypothetical protein
MVKTSRFLDKRSCFGYCGGLWLLASLIMPAFWVYAAPSKTASVSEGWGWSLPLVLSDDNTKVSFELSSTWHDLHGSSSRITGRVWLDNEQDSLSIRAIINFPVSQLSTGGEMRDERMFEVMDSDHHHFVTVAIDSILPQCQAKGFALGESCSVVLSARLSIRGNERALSLPGIMSRDNDSAKLSGSVKFSWVDFGVEDPSILVAKLDPEMQVSYSVTVPLKR